MTDHNKIDETDPATTAWYETRAKLVEAETELAKLRAAAESQKIHAEAMKSRVIRAEIAARRPVDAEAVEALVSRHIAVGDDGEFYAITKNGNPAIGDGPEFGNVSLESYLDAFVKQRPALFQSEDAKPAPTRSARSRNAAAALGIQGNPFRPGPDHNLTAQMVLMKQDPVLAEDMAAEAGVSLRRP